MELIELLQVIGATSQPFMMVFIAIAFVYTLIKQNTSAQTTILTDQNAAMLRLQGHVEAEASRGDRYAERMIKAEIESAQRDARLTVMEDELKDAKTSLKTALRKLDNQETLAGTNAATIKRLEADVQKKDRALKELAAELSQFRAQLESRDRIIDKLTTQVGELESALAKRDGELATVRTELAEEVGKRQESDKRNAALTVRVEELAAGDGRISASAPAPKPAPKSQGKRS